MQWFGRILAHALVRRIAFVIVAALLAWAGIGRAEAACRTGNSCDTKAEAYDAVLYKGSDFCPVYGQPNATESATYVETDVTATTGRVTAYYKCNGATVAQMSATWSSVCPVGQEWNPDTYKCETGCPGGYGEDPYNAGQCMDQDKCRARNSSINTSALRIGGDTCVNLGGCAFEADTSGSLSASTSEGSLTMYPFSYSGRPGSACAAPPPPDPEPPEPKPECLPAGNGQTMCIRPDGQHCYSSAPGKSSGFCWKPGETGEQTNGPDRQDRKPGNDPPPPNLNLNNGDTLQPKPGGPITSTTNTGGNTIITTVINYGTTNGTNAGSGSGKGDSGTGDISKPGGGGNDTGSGDGSGTSASGGGDCKTPPVVQGDAALNMVATQAWATRCAVKAGNAVKVTGDIADCAQPFTVVGDTAGMSEGENRLGVEQLKALRKSYCGDQDTDTFDAVGYAQGVVDGVADSTGGPGEAFSDGSEGGGGGDGPGDDSGLGYTRTCPNLPTVEIMGATLDFDAAAGGRLCDWISLGGYFVLLLASILSVRILASGSSV